MTTFEIIISIVSVLATAGIFSGLYKIGKKVGSFEGEIKNIGNSMEKLPCKQREKEIRDVHDDVLAIKIFLTSKYKNTESIWGAKHSPTMLNENGISLYKNIDGEQFLSSNKDFFIQKIDEKTPKTPLDVEIAAHEVLIENTDNDIFNSLKNWVYESPSMQIKEGEMMRDYIVSLYDVCYVLSLPLRDMYLDLHPDLIPAKESH